MEKEGNIVIESEPVEKNRIWKILIIILIILLLAGIFIVISLKVQNYIQTNKNETNGTKTNLTEVPSTNGSNINITYTLKTSVCGDKKCNGTENYTNCAKDCRKSTGSSGGTNPPCTSDCANKNCGDNGCKGICGTCNSTQVCNSTFLCEYLACSNDYGCTSAGIFCNGNNPYSCSNNDSDSCLERTNMTSCSFGYSCVQSLGCQNYNQCLASENCFYVSVTGAGTHNGSTGNELNLSQAMDYSNAHPGTALTFNLLSGNYGEVNINRGFGTLGAWVSYIGNGARFNRLTITKNGDAYLRFENLNVTFPFMPGNNCTGGKYCGALVSFDNSGSIEFYNLSVFGYVDEYGGYSSFYGIFSKNARNIIINRCEVNNIENGIEFWSGDNIKVSGCKVHNFRGSAIRTGGGQNYIFKNNTVHDFKRTDDSNPEVYLTYIYNPAQGCSNAPTGYCDHGGSGFAIHSSNTILSGNTIYNCCPSRPLWFYHGHAGALGYTNSVIENNLAYNLTNWVEVTDMGKNFTISNNTFPTMIIHFAQNATGIENYIYNNIFIYGISLNQYGAVSTINSSIANKFWANVSEYGNIYPGAASTGCGYLCTYPKISENSSTLLFDSNKIISFFNNPSNGDYHPSINNPVCNGSFAPTGNSFAGALDCVCTQNSQCVDVFGGGSTCNTSTQKCSASIPNKQTTNKGIWTWIKNLAKF